MTKTILSIIFTSTFTIFQTNSLSAQEWKLVWAEEFNYSGPPADSIWDYEIGYLRNKELQYYTNKKENVKVEDGNCIIEARKENDTLITSASIITFGKKDFLYGRIEVSAKIPKGLGTWPAIWMAGINKLEVPWPGCGEIDILENVGYDSTRIHANIHTKAYNHTIGTGKGNNLVAEKPWDDFHVYALEWFDDRLEFYYDDSLYFSFKNDFENNYKTWPFDKPHYLLINLAFGGNWGGSKVVDKGILPVRYEIDYVRYYKLNNTEK